MLPENLEELCLQNSKLSIFEDQMGSTIPPFLYARINLLTSPFQ